MTASDIIKVCFDFIYILYKNRYSEKSCYLECKNGSSFASNLFVSLFCYAKKGDATSAKMRKF